MCKENYVRRLLEITWELLKKITWEDSLISLKCTKKITWENYLRRKSLEKESLRLFFRPRIKCEGCCSGPLAFLLIPFCFCFSSQEFVGTRSYHSSRFVFIHTVCPLFPMGKQKWRATQYSNWPGLRSVWAPTWTRQCNNKPLVTTYRWPLATSLSQGF